MSLATPASLLGRYFRPKQSLSPLCMTSAVGRPVVDRDFFGFCTTLKPLELKALGALSQIRHLGAGEVIYAAGDPADTLYIINRGVVEVVADPDKKKSDTYLSRGDIFGDVEVLTEHPRKHQVRAHEPVSLQCFNRKDFAEITKRIPSFFQYLSEQLALRLSQVNDVTLAQSHCLELSGSLSNFDLVTIYQTIVNSSQTGELRICNSKSDLVAALFFEKGQPRGGQFEHLIGEEAFRQLFLHESMDHSFSFSADDRPVSTWVQADPIERNQYDLLINALQGRDELQQLKLRIPQAEAYLHRLKQRLALPPGTAPELEPVAKEIWALADEGPVNITNLFRRCSFSELRIYQAVHELLETGHFETSCNEFAEEVA